MDALQKDLDRLTSTSNLSKPINTIDETIKLIEEARASITVNSSALNCQIQAAKLQQAATKQVEKLKSDMKEVYQGLSKYSKNLDKKFKTVNLVDIADLDYEALGAKSGLINRAIVMHLAREGRFDVAEQFIKEIQQKGTDGGDFANQIPSNLRAQFETMYEIVECIEKGDLEAAIHWAREHHTQLNDRRSRLEWELVKTMYLTLAATEGHARAIVYSRDEFARFYGLYKFEIQQVVSSPMFDKSDSITARPYPHLQTILSPERREELSTFFRREYCSLMGLSATSPLYLAATAGAIALPKLVKVSSIMKDKKTAWSSHNELPVEIPLPPSFSFHQIVVCPVSKEQTTEKNPPVMLPCGHVIAEESKKKLLERPTAHGKLKCPYCPKDCSPDATIRVYL